MGFDPSLNNWGLAYGTYDLQSHELDILELGLIQPDVPKGKQTRQNSKDLIAAYQLAKRATEFIELYTPQVIFVEVPHGSQSARSMASYGICIGVLGALRAGDSAFFELTATEVKLAAVNTKKATKDQMIAWAMDKHPNAPWPMYTKSGQQTVVAGKAEHMADAVAAIHAGIQLSEFRQIVSLAA